jgi:hypothetical protein
MAGIRSWTGRTMSFAGTVRSAQVKRGLAPSCDRHASHIPAKAKGPPSFRRKCQGRFLRPPSCCHSKNPSAGIGQRRFCSASAKVGFVAAVSARALMGAFLASDAQAGTNPQRKNAGAGRPSLVGPTVRTSWDGATLKRSTGRACQTCTNSSRRRPS